MTRQAFMDILPDELCPTCESGNCEFVREVPGLFRHRDATENEWMPTNLLRCLECGTEWVDSTVWTPEGYTFVTADESEES